VFNATVYRPTASIALAALLVLAGCTGVNPLDDGNADTTTDGNLSLVDEDEVSTTTNGGETTSTPDTEPSGEQSATPPGVAANGSVVNVSALLAAHREQLRSLSAFRLAVLREGRNTTTRTELRVVNDQQRMVGSVTGSELGDRRIYHTNGTIYRKFSDGIETESEPFGRVHGASGGFLRILGQVTLTFENTTTVRGQTVQTYRLSDLRNQPSIENATGHVQVTPSGLIVELELRAVTSAGQVLDQRYAIEDINDVTVETPEWVEEYRQGDGESDDSSDDTGDETDGGGFPRISWEFSLRDDGRVTLGHEGGEAAESLTVRYTVDGETVNEIWGPEGDITAGDTYTTEEAPDDGSVIQVIWEGEDRTVVIAQREVRRE